MTPGRPHSAHSPGALVGVVAVCAASAGAHAALAPQHLDHEPRLGVAFVAASALLVVVAAALVSRPGPYARRAAMLALAALIGAYALNVTTGIPWLTGGAEPADVVGLATKAVEALGLVLSLQLTTTMGGRRSPTYEEART